MCQEIYYSRNWWDFFGPFVPNNVSNYKNIDNIYYPRNCENLHNKTNDILVEKGPTWEINVNLLFRG